MVQCDRRRIEAAPNPSRQTHRGASGTRSAPASFCHISRGNRQHSSNKAWANCCAVTASDVTLISDLAMIARLCTQGIRALGFEGTENEALLFFDAIVKWTIFAAGLAAMLGLAAALSGCGTAPLERGGSLASYDNMAVSDGTLTKSLIKVSKQDVLAAKTVRIVPTAFSAAASQVEFTDEQRRLVSNTVDRALCVGLSDRFQVVGLAEPADLTVQAVVTHAGPTNELAAGTSKVASVIPAFFSLGFPVPVPRLPVGLGSLSVEAEARGPGSDQKAAMIWGRGADSITSKPKVSKAGDAYDLASAFGDDFSNLLVTGESPLGKAPALPSLQKVATSLGGAPKYPACEAFGRGPGVAGMVSGGVLGLPPEWSDKGARQ